MNKKACSRYPQQKGIALLYVLIIFSIIAVMASQIVTNLMLHTEKNARLLERTQAKHYALGAEQYVALLLEADFQSDKKKKRQVDHEKEAWNVKTVPYAVDQGKIDITVIDEQGRFNLNGLRADGDNGLINLNMFKNLLTVLSIDTKLANNLQTWLGATPDSSKGAAADNIYLVLDPPRRAGNNNMASISELRLVQGMDEESFEKLAPCVTVLPQPSRININTALPEIIMSISNKLTASDAANIIAARGKEGFAKLGDLSNIIDLKNKMNELRVAPLSFSSHYFTVYVTALYRDTVFYLKTRLYRNNEGKVQVIAREIGPNRYWAAFKKES
ncbi:type II secretion system minor pseudopilin GspK [Candidatus Sororendozoicomonas aggregata]|uniref:type II secretion system minor pseudopilin GspK n=1 Tax=Candidatus Sororendozoicomonas aggregata TaxID=3073239 RepID=UPI002ED5C3E8